MEDLVGNKGYQWTALNFEDFWTVQSEAAPILRCFAEEIPDLSQVEKAYDISWYTGRESSYTIHTVKELYGLYILSINDSFEGIDILLGSDITLNVGDASAWGDSAPANYWYPIYDFSGTFDGQNHTIIWMCIFR